MAKKKSDKQSSTKLLPEFSDWIKVRGARTHNLKNIDVDLPRDRLVVITGLSGSGKSSLAFDTLFAEGQRRYLECLSAQTRQFLHQLEKPDVDSISGLAPTICVDQRVTAARIRSTLATTTEIFDYVRLLFARAGQAHCPDCNEPVSQQSVDSIVDRVMHLEAGRKVMLIAPLVVGRKGAHREVFEKICKAGFVRARVNGEVVDAASPPELARGKAHTIEAIVDRLIVKPGIEARLKESVELTLKHGEGSCLISELVDDVWNDRLYSSKYACSKCGTSYPPLEPRSFSFNSPYGACPTCRGLGRVVPEENEERVERTDEFWSVPACGECHGARIGRFQRAVTLWEYSLPRLMELTVEDAARIIGDLAEDAAQQQTLTPEGQAAARTLVPEIVSRLKFLERVGVGYLQLNRPSRTLSGGEFQRARLASCLGSSLVGVCYVLDEPTIGLHPRDTQRLVDVFNDLRDRGNSVLVVEHDLEVMRAADWLIDLGPGAGREGGRVLWSGRPQELVQQRASQDSQDSQTARVLRNESPSSNHKRSRAIDSNRRLVIDDVWIHNLRGLRAEIPLGVFVTITGVSGSGKTSLISHALVPAIKYGLTQRERTQLTQLKEHGLPCSSLSGLQDIDRIVVVDQSPLGRSGRSNPASHTGIWDHVRHVFAKTRDARLRGFGPQRFSFLSPDGRCAACRGQGLRRLEMNFLPDLMVTCSECRGQRFNAQTLHVKYRDKNVAEVLKLRVDEAVEFFANFPKLKAVLDVLCGVGLGYLELGQPASTLSGGEAQRIKLAAELAKGGTERVLYVLDEPTTGLHPADVERLIELLQQLVDRGQSVLVVEHNLDLIRSSDWTIDLGPEGGASGGQIVSSDRPEKIAQNPELSATAAALADAVSRDRDGNRQNHFDE